MPATVKQRMIQKARSSQRYREFMGFLRYFSRIQGRLQSLDARRREEASEMVASEGAEGARFVEVGRGICVRMEG